MPKNLAMPLYVYLWIRLVKAFICYSSSKELQKPYLGRSWGSEEEKHIASCMGGFPIISFLSLVSC